MVDDIYCIQSYSCSSHRTWGVLDHYCITQIGWRWHLGWCSAFQSKEMIHWCVGVSYSAASAAQRARHTSKLLKWLQVGRLLADQGPLLEGISFCFSLSIVTQFVTVWVAVSDLSSCSVDSCTITSNNKQLLKWECLRRGKLHHINIGGPMLICVWSRQKKKIWTMLDLTDLTKSGAVGWAYCVSQIVI